MRADRASSFLSAIVYILTAAVVGDCSSTPTTVPAADRQFLASGVDPDDVDVGPDPFFADIAGYSASDNTETTIAKRHPSRVIVEVYENESKTLGLAWRERRLRWSYKVR